MHRATAKKEGSIELRITWQRKQRFATTGIRVLPRQWRNGRIVNRIDAVDLQDALDLYIARARKIINDQSKAGILDMDRLVAAINKKDTDDATAKVRKAILPFMRERAEIRKYGRSVDSCERYDRFLRWFENWGGIVTFDDVSEINILRMDKALADTGMKNYSKWQNYHRFLNSFILDAIDEGFIRKNPYKSIHIEKEKSSTGIGKYLTVEEFRKLESLKPPTDFLRHALDLFIFQTYTCLSYTDLEGFDATNIKYVRERRVYTANRGKTKQEFTFLLLAPAAAILDKYHGVLPIMSNAKYNDCLKILAMSAGIDKPISSHWARHTGATMLLNMGVEMEVVAKVLGHSSTKITRQVYAKLLDDTVADAMERFERRLAGIQ
jgi:site-specific recombinase XerD